MNAKIDEEEDRLFIERLKVMDAAFCLRRPDAADSAMSQMERFIAAGRQLQDQAAINARAAQEQDGRFVGHNHFVIFDARASTLEAMAAKAFGRAQAIHAIMDRHRNANLLDPSGRDAPTPETAVKPGRENTIRALRELGHLEHHHETKALEIATILEALTASQNARAQYGMMGGGKGGVPTDFMPAYLAEWHSWRYLPWCGAMLADMQPDISSPPKRRGVVRNRFQSLPLVLYVVRDGISLDPARRRCRMSWEKAKRLLRNGLDLYDAISDCHEKGNNPLLLERLRKRAGTAWVIAYDHRQK